MGTKRPFSDLNSSSKKAKCGHWSQGLLSSMNDPDLQVQSDNHTVVIKDKYPKAKYHYLVLPKADISGLKQININHLDLLKNMDTVGRELAKKHKDSRFLIGYHAVPSMSRLHLHVISDDFHSICLKTKKHWNSFTTEFFIPSEKLINELEFSSRIVIPSSMQVKDFMEQSLKCHKCNFKPKTMPQLKEHLKEHL